MRRLIVIASAVAVLTASSVLAQRKPAPKTTRPASSQTVTGPKARYAMDVGTMTGIGGMGGMGGMAGGGGRPNIGEMMAGMGGRRGGDQHELRLRLGSTLAATGAAQGDHYFLPQAAMGASVPLLAPQRTGGREDVPESFERPKGRLLIFWGCGAHARPGQPVVIDFAKLAAGQMPPDLFSARVPVDRGPTLANSRSYAEWPNPRSGRQPQGGSLLGDHRVQSTFAPSSAFNLQQDYLQGLHVRTGGGPDGAVQLSWNGVPMATGYYAWMMGAKDAGRRGNSDTGDIVWWSSSTSREFGGALWDWISPATAQRLVSDGTLLAPTQTNCVVPAEVKQAAGEMMFGTLIGYGPESTFVYPERPATGPWNQEWSARVRFRTSATFFPGMPEMDDESGGERSNGDRSSSERPRKRCKPSLLGAVTGLGGC